MNPRIKKLKEQATSYTWNGNDVTEELDEEKFALLIVAECCAKVERQYKYATKQTSTWSMSQNIQDMLKKHFGVE